VLRSSVAFWFTDRGRLREYRSKADDAARPFFASPQSQQQ
jgi:hypothetical protein